MNAGNSPSGAMAVEPEPLAHEPRRFDSGKSPFLQFVLFEKMISLWVLIILYWLSVLFFVGYGIFSIIASFALMAELGRQGGAREGNLIGLLGVCGGFATMIIGPLVSRVYFEVIIVLFRMNETLLEIRDNTRR